MPYRQRRIQIRVSQVLYDKLLLEAIHCNIPFAQVCRVHLSGKKIVNDMGETE